MAKKIKELSKKTKGMIGGVPANTLKQIGKMRIERIKTLDEMSDQYTDKEKKFIKLIKRGFTIKEATISMGYGINKGQREAIKLVKYSLRSDKLVKKAHKVIEEVLANTPKLQKVKGEKEIYSYPTHNHRIKAAEMVYERYEPVVKAPLVQLNQALSPIDLSRYKLVEKEQDDGVIEVEAE